MLLLYAFTVGIWCGYGRRSVEHNIKKKKETT